ncbi:MAG: DUF2189 domain-containing protein [Steroidobacteraceae bacterium]
MSTEASRQDLPFVAPCRQIPASAPLGWIVRGWHDFTRAPLQSMTYGLAIALLGMAITGLAWRYGSNWVVLLLLPSFVFVAPVLAMGFYAISAELARGEKPTLRRCFLEERCRLGDAMVYSLVLLVVFLLWMRAGTGVHVFYPALGNPTFSDLLGYFTIGSAVGAVFALISFAASAFSLPMLLDRRTDGVTAAVTSAHAVLKNKPAMLVWIALILLAVIIGFATAFVGLVVTMPVIGHATWHAYKDTIDASAWPPNC